MGKLGKKEGLATRQEIKFFVDLISENFDFGFVYNTGIKLILPILIDSIDNKVGDKLPEPWQTYAEDLITSVYEALQDKVLSEEEVEEILSNVAKILAAEINVPLMEEADEVMAFEFLLKFIATQIRVAIKNRRERKE